MQARGLLGDALESGMASSSPSPSWRWHGHLTAKPPGSRLTDSLCPTPCLELPLSQAELQLGRTQREAGDPRPGPNSALWPLPLCVTQFTHLQSSCDSCLSFSTLVAAVSPEKYIIPRAVVPASRGWNREMSRALWQVSGLGREEEQQPPSPGTNSATPPSWGRTSRPG